MKLSVQSYHTQRQQRRSDESDIEVLILVRAPSDEITTRLLGTFF